MIRNFKKTSIWPLVLGLIFMLYGLFSLTGCAPVISKPVERASSKGTHLKCGLERSGYL